MKNSDKFNKYRPLMKDLYETAKEKLGFKPDASIYIVSDAQNSQNPLGKTAYYSPAEHKISLYVDGRHIKDILRSLSHELVHHNQNCRGEFENRNLSEEVRRAQAEDRIRVSSFSRPNPFEAAEGRLSERGRAADVVHRYGSDRKTHPAVA